MGYPRALEQLIAELQRLPGIGAKTAERLAFHLLKVDRTEALGLARAITALKETVHHCQVCFNLSETSPCSLCGEGRDRTQICVVEEPRDALMLEKTGRYRGTYHVLLGRIAPLDGVTADDLTIAALTARIDAGGVAEVILATNPDLEGDATALHIAELCAARGVPTTRLARGLPTGSALEHTSAALLGDAMLGRTAFENAGVGQAGQPGSSDTQK